MLDEIPGVDATLAAAIIAELSVDMRVFENLSKLALSSRRISRCLYHMAKSRWHIENEGFNDAKNRYGLEHIRHHHERSLLITSGC